MGLVGGVVGSTIVIIAAIVVGRKRWVTTREKGTRSSKSPEWDKPTERMIPCPRCGNMLAQSAVFCEKCGAPLESLSPESGSLEERVYDYIVKHEGVISISKAAEDMGTSVEELKRITEKLKNQGRLS
jgi:uncharacterized protein with PIN domain